VSGSDTRIADEVPAFPPPGSSPDSQCSVFSASFRSSFPFAFIPILRSPSFCAVSTAASPSTTTRPRPWTSATPWPQPSAGFSSPYSTSTREPFEPCSTFGCAVRITAVGPCRRNIVEPDGPRTDWPV